MATVKKRKWVLEAAVYSALRRAFRSSPAVNEAWDRAKTEYFVKSKHGKDMRRVQFTCASCGLKYPKGKGRGATMQMDHIEPVVDVKDGNRLPDGSIDWNKQIRRLIVTADGLQPLCRDCHKKKSTTENAARKANKKAIQAQDL